MGQSAGISWSGCGLFRVDLANGLHDVGPEVVFLAVGAQLAVCSSQNLSGTLEIADGAGLVGDAFFKGGNALFQLIYDLSLIHV